MKKFQLPTSLTLILTIMQVNVHAIEADVKIKTIKIDEILAQYQNLQHILQSQHNKTAKQDFVALCDREILALKSALSKVPSDAKNAKNDLQNFINFVHDIKQTSDLHDPQEIATLKERHANKIESFTEVYYKNGNIGYLVNTNASKNGAAKKIAEPVSAQAASSWSNLKTYLQENPITSAVIIAGVSAGGWYIYQQYFVNQDGQADYYAHK